MRLFNKLFLGFYLCFCFTAAQAQYRFDSWTTDNGLPQNTVLSIVKTRDGYLWAGTYEGLTRFDGVGFTVFDSVNTPEMKSNFVEVLLEDRAGNLWIGIDGGGLLRRTDNQFTRYSKSEGLPSDNVMSLLEDRAGNLWIGTDGGLSLLRDGKLTNFTAQDGLPDENIRALAEDDEGSLWLGTDKGLARLKDGKFTVYTQNDDLTNNRVRSLWWSQTDGLWIGTASGLNRWQNNRFIEFGAKEEAVNLNIQCVVEDSAGVLWIGTDRRGLFRLKQNELISESKTIGGLADESIPTIYRDSEETIWVGGYTTGLNRFREARFRTFSRADGLQEDDVKAVYEDRTGNLWFGTNKTLYRLTEGILKIYSPVGTFLNQITTIAEDRDGNLWFGGNGITRYQNGQFTHFTTKDGLSDVRIFTVLGDRAGNVWIGTVGKGLNLLRDGRFTVYTTRDGLVNDYVISLFEDRAGALWIGTRNGLSRFQNGQFTNWTTADGLSRDHILSYYEDAGGALWLGTSGGGLNRYKDGQFATVTSRDGLYDNLAFQILDDANGNIWMSGNKGIYRANLQELNDFADGRASSVTSYSYGTADGMLSRECNGANPAGWKTRDGNLWFPTVKGLVIINPQEYNTEPPAIVIEQAKVDEAAQPIGEAIQITPEQENLEIKYTAISWQRPQQIKFKYQLVGLDQDWTDAGTRRTAYYSHLPAGEYTFKVIADNGDGVWNLEGKSLRVSVLPPFYQTVWFYALCVLAIYGAAFVVYKIRINRLEKAHRAQEDFSRRLINAHEAERSRVAAELHDSIGQTLAMIKNRAVFGTQTTENLAAAHEQFDAITAQTMQAIGEVREISYNLRPYLLENLGLTKAIKSLVHKIEEVPLLTIDARICNVDNLFAPEAEMSVYRIVQESLNNVAKHAEADEAALIIEKTNAIVTIKIADDGRGFDKNAPPKTDAEKAASGFWELPNESECSMVRSTFKQRLAAARN